MKLIMTSLAKALPAVSNTMAVIFAFQLVFAILGMQLFMGALSQCTDPTLPTRELCHPPDTCRHHPSWAMKAAISAWAGVSVC